MARPTRLFVPGFPAHATFRGGNRQVLFREESDYFVLHREFISAAQRNGLEVHAYVFMPNHVHLVASGRERLSLSKTVQDVARKYVRNFNDRYGRTGALWQGRFWSALIADDEYYFNCHRYVELNPVRARMVDAAGDYPWSSHEYYARGRPDDLVTAHRNVIELSDNFEERRAAFLSLFEQPLGPAELEEIRHATHSGHALGKPSVRCQIEDLAGRPVQPRKRGRPRGR